MIISILIYPRSEDGCTHTNHRAAVLDGDVIVVTHAPAALAEGRRIGEILRFYFIKELSGSIKLTGYLLLIIRIRCHHHQTANLNMRQLAPLTSFQKLAAGIQ